MGIAMTLSRRMLLASIALGAPFVPIVVDAQPQDISGAWAGYVAGEGFRYNVVVVFEHTQNQLSGHMVENMTRTQIQGSVKRSIVTFSKLYPSSSSGYRLVYAGYIDVARNRISGEWTGKYPPPNDRGTFELTRQ